MIGKILDKYEILEELGQGGMATVYLARDLRLDREVAVKVLHPHLARQEVARQRFHREAQAVARLKHPHILEIYDYSGPEAPVAYMVMELVRGPTLREHLNQRQPKFPEIGALIVIPVLRALEHAHRHGIVHRDVKPENVMIREDGVVKLTDFGIAHIADVQGMTATGTVLGSPAHMSPEQIEGKRLGPASDIFAVGTVLYRLVTGRLPFDAPYAQALFRKILQGEYQPAQQLAPLVSDSMNRIIDQALRVSPGDRFPSAGAMADALLEELELLGLGSVDSELGSYFANPGAYEVWLEPILLERLVEMGNHLLAEGRRIEALSTFNRALCISPEEPRVLEAVQSIGEEDRVRRLMTWGGGVVGLLVAVFLAWLLVRGGAGEAGGVMPSPGADAGVVVGGPMDAGAVRQRDLGAKGGYDGSPRGRGPLVRAAGGDAWADPGGEVRAQVAGGDASGAVGGSGPSVRDGGAAAMGTAGRDAGVVGRDAGVVGRDAGVVGRDAGVVGRDAGGADAPYSDLGSPANAARVVDGGVMPPKKRRVTRRAPQPKPRGRPVEQIIVTEPWTTVRVDGKVVSRENMRHVIELTRGRHVITLENPGCYPKTFRVDVGPRTEELKELRTTLKWREAKVEVVGPPRSSVFYYDSAGRPRLLGDAKRGVFHHFPMSSPMRRVTLKVVTPEGEQLVKTVVLRPNEKKTVVLPER